MPLHPSGALYTRAYQFVCVIFVAFGIWASGGTNEPANAQSMLSLYNSALENDPTLQAAELEGEIGQREARDALFAYFPRLKAQFDEKGRRQRVIDSQNSVFALGQEDYEITEGFAELRQPLFDWEAVATIKRGRALEYRAAAALAAEQQKLILRLSETYLQTLSAAEKVDLLSAAAQVTAKELVFVRERASAGKALKSEVADVQAQKSLVESELVDAQNELDDAYEALSEMVGFSVDFIVPFRSYVPTRTLSPQNPMAWIERALVNNNELIAQEFAIDVATAERQQVLGQNLPKVDFVGTYDYLDQGGSLFGGGSEGDDWTVGVQVRVPIFNHEGYGYQGRKKVLERDVQIRKLDLMRRKIRREATNFYRLAMGAERKIAALNDAVAASRRRLNDSREERKAGKATTIDVLEAQRENLRSQRDLFDAHIEYLLATLRLKERAGALSEQDIAFINNYLG